MVVQTTLGKTELYKELSDSIEQTFQQQQKPVKGKSDGAQGCKKIWKTGLVWVSYPSSYPYIQENQNHVPQQWSENLLSKKEMMSSGETPGCHPL